MTDGADGMRIAVVSVHGCPCISPGTADAGGMNVYVDEVAARMASRGDGVRVYARAHCGMDAARVRQRYALVHIPAGDLSLPKTALPKVLPDFTAGVVADARRAGIDFDVVATHYWLSGVVGVELARIWDVPHVTSFHTMASLKRRVRPDESEPVVRFREEARVARSADRVVVWTAEEARHVRDEFGVDAARVAIIPPGVDVERFVPTADADRDDGRRRVLYVGRLDAFKGVDLLIDAFALVAERCDDAELRIVGGGSADEFRRVLGQISALRLERRVQMFGVRPQTELPVMYADADCIVAPSFHETFGLAVLEAAACGTPAVAADVGGLRSIVADDDTGFLVDGRDPAVYAARIATLLADDARRARMARAARRRAMTFSWDAAVAALLGEYRHAELAVASS